MPMECRKCGPLTSSQLDGDGRCKACERIVWEQPEDELEDPADSRPCGCEETEALKAERDTFREMARERGDLLVSEVERRLAAERACTTTTERLYAQARTMLADGALLERIEAAITEQEEHGSDYGEGNTYRAIRDLLRAHKAGGS